MSTLLQLGAFGGGFIQGRNAEQDRRHVMESRERERRMKDMQEKANAAARDAYQGYAKQFEPRTEEQVTAVSGGGSQPPAIESGGMGLGGGAPASMPSAQFGDMSGGAKPSLGGMGLAEPQQRVPTQQVQAQAPGKFDERQGVLAGMKARRKYLMENGAGPDVWGADFAKESALSEQLRAEPIKNAFNRYAATRDFGAYAKVVYPLIDDGVSIVDAKQEMGVDGKPLGWRLVLDEDGKSRSVLVDPEMERQLLMLSASPEERIKHELQASLLRIKANEGVRQAQGAEAAKQGTEGVKLANNLALEAARFKNDRALKGMVSGDKSADLRKPMVLSEGQIAVAPGKDGKYETKAEGKPRTLGSTAQPSAGNRVLNLRQEALDAIRRGAPQAEVEREFRLRTGEDLGGL